ncbi:hypothetical protein PHMEG_00018464 [Phytophthora megakarya]|uniref:Uncharacterized protein n=1 Tax=Phytophthora megakarya TaxID=4795 RepID=A0A225VVA6_9STRA|nr:hypothetical protein PHMEG_00018464 [Phytophthora megakarya]
MKSSVPHLWGLSFIYTRILLNDDRLGNTASSNDNSDGATYPRAKVRCNTSTTLRIFQARSVCALGFLFELKCRLREISRKRSRERTESKHPREMAPTSAVFQ